jgi:nucleolar protein 4
MKAQLLCSVALITGTLSMTAFAEAPVQAGETLESLSQVKVSTTVNGQPGSIADLVNSGKVQVIAGAQPSAPAMQPAPAPEMAGGAEAPMQAPANAAMPAPEAAAMPAPEATTQPSGAAAPQAPHANAMPEQPAPMQAE